MYPMSGFDIRLVFTLPPRDSTLQYKRCVHFEITFLALHPCVRQPLSVKGFKGTVVNHTRHSTNGGSLEMTPPVPFC